MIMRQKLQYMNVVSYILFPVLYINILTIKVKEIAYSILLV